MRAIAGKYLCREVYLLSHRLDIHVRLWNGINVSVVMGVYPHSVLVGAEVDLEVGHGIGDAP